MHLQYFERGGYMHAKITKLEDQFISDKSKAEREGKIESSIFRGVSVFVNGYTKPSADEIKSLMARHGGNYVHYYTRAKVTHTVASNLPFSKIKALKPGQMVVRPEWITDSIAAGKLLPTLAYEQYTNNRGQTNLGFASDVKTTSDDVTTAPDDVTVASDDTSENKREGIPEKHSEEGEKNPSSEKSLEEVGNLVEEPLMDDIPSAFRQLVPNARLTPVKENLKHDLKSESPTKLTPTVKLFEKTDIDAESPVQTPARKIRGFDPKTPYVFDPGNASTPFLGTKNVAKVTKVADREKDPTDSQVQAWLNEPDSECSQIMESPEGSYVRGIVFEKSESSRKPSTDSRKPSTDSRNSRHSVDLFESSVDGDAADLDGRNSASSKGSRKSLKRRLDLTLDYISQKSKKSEEVPVSPTEPVEMEDFSLQISDSEAEFSDSNVDEYKNPRNAKLSDVQSDDSLTKKSKSDNKSEESRKKKLEESNPNESKSERRSPQKKALRAGDANFVSEFYNNSRLHHLSTWGAECRDYVTLLQSEGDMSFPGRQRLAEHLKATETTGSQSQASGETVGQSGSSVHGLSQSERVVMHIDMDCFFVAVGLRNRPELKGKPVAVTHSKSGVEPTRREGQDPELERDMWMKKKFGKSKLKVSGASSVTESISNRTLRPSEAKNSSMAEIASCSYEARKAGLKNGMFLGRALQMCPDLVTIPYDFQGYSDVSRLLYDTVACYTHHIEAVSCDELFVDCTEVLKSVPCTGKQFADFLRQEIYEKTQCTASAGLGPNILVSRLATRVAKPDGSYQLLRGEIHEFMQKQNVKDLPGVGWSTLPRLEALGISTCQNLQQMSLGALRREFGQKTGSLLHRYCRGEDDREVKSEKVRKSVSAEINYGIRFTKHEESYEFIRELAVEVQSRMRKIQVSGKAITLKMKIRSEGAPKETSKFGGHGVCDNVSKSAAVATATDDCDVIARECQQLYKALKIDPSDLRGMGIQVTKLVYLNDKLDKRQNTLNFTAAPKPEVPSNTSVTTPVQVTSSSGVTSSTSHDTRKTSERSVTSSKLGTGLTLMKTPERVVTTGNGDDFLVSPSQVDPDVLNELPVELQQQIRAAMQRAGRRDVTKDSTMTSSVPPAPTGTKRNYVEIRGDSARPGCSHWSSGSDALTTPSGKRDDDVIMLGDDVIMQDVDDVITEERDGNEADDELPSFSQVDPDCLDALPASIREEILTAYARRTRDTTPTADEATPTGEKTTPTKMMALSWKAGAGRSPAKSPRKKSPAKSPKKSPGKFKPPTRRTVKRYKKSPQKRAGPIPLPRPVVTPREPVVTSSPVVQSETPVALCDAVSLPDVKALVEEWMTSCPSPDQADVERFQNYLKALVLDTNLEQVILLIKFIRRRIAKLPVRQLWQDAADDVIDYVQACVTQYYGAPLKLTT